MGSELRLFHCYETCWRPLFYVLVMGSICEEHCQSQILFLIWSGILGASSFIAPLPPQSSAQLSSVLRCFLGSLCRCPSWSRVKYWWNTLWKQFALLSSYTIYVRCKESCDRLGKNLVYKNKLIANRVYHKWWNNCNGTCIIS